MRSRRRGVGKSRISAGLGIIFRPLNRISQRTQNLLTQTPFRTNVCYNATSNAFAHSYPSILNTATSPFIPQAQAFRAFRAGFADGPLGNHSNRRKRRRRRQPMRVSSDNSQVGHHDDYSETDANTIFEQSPEQRDDPLPALIPCGDSLPSSRPRMI